MSEPEVKSLYYLCAQVVQHPQQCCVKLYLRNDWKMGKCSERSTEALKDKKASCVVKDSQSTDWLDYWELKTDLTALEAPTWRAETWL